MKKIFTAILALLILASCNQAPKSDEPASTSKVSKDRPTMKIGYMICNSEKETNERFGAFTKYMSEQLDINFEMASIDTTQFMRELDTMHFTHTNSLLYVMMNRFHGVEILATEQKDSLGSKSQGIILVRSDSDIKTIADLKGRTVLFGPTLAPTGFMSQVDLMQQNGIDPDKDLAFYTVPTGSFKHEKVIYGVEFERYDAGSIPLGDVEIMTEDNRINPDDFRIIAKAEPIPYCNFAVTQKVDEKLAQRFKEVLLSITHDTTVEYEGERVKVLKKALVDGYEATKDSDFDIVREMAKRTNMPPYQKF